VDETVRNLLIRIEKVAEVRFYIDEAGKRSIARVLGSSEYWEVVSISN
jgi:hypothetical protein